MILKSLWRVQLVAIVVLVALSCSSTGEVVVPEATPETTDSLDARSSFSDTERQVQTNDQLPMQEGFQIVGRFAWELSECEFLEPVEVMTTCGWLEVPTKWDDPDSDKTIQLHVGLFSTGPTDLDPLVYLEGGPGGDALTNISQRFDFFLPLVEDRDLVVIGQRGTGSARPHLQCENVLELELAFLNDPSDLERWIKLERAAYAHCAEQLRADDINLSAFNSVMSAHDVEALRLALGFDEWNVLGVSYGTRLAQTLMRIYPSGIRAVILDSVLAIERDPVVDGPVITKRAFETLFKGCADSRQCASKFGDLETRYFALVNKLDKNPVTFQATDLESGLTYPVWMDGSGLISHTFGALYSRWSFSALPELIAQLEVGETSGISALLSQTITSIPFVARGMFWSVFCNEEVPFITPESEMNGLTGETIYDRTNPKDTIAALEGICASFDVGSAPAIENNPVVSDLPVLILAGSYDPITPPADGESLLNGMSSAFFFEYPHTGHAVLTNECAQSMAVDFLEAPLVAPDSVCIASITEPDWTPDIFSELDFEPFSYDSGFTSGSGVMPTGWEDLGDGIFALSDHLLHQSLIIQETFSAISTNVLVDNVGGAIGGELVEVGSLHIGANTWTRFEAKVPGYVVDLVVTNNNGDTLMVFMQHAPSDHQRALNVLLPPMLDALSE